MAEFYISLEAYRKNICTGFFQLQQSEEFVDMTLAADGHLVKVHKSLMALASPYIKEMLQSAPCPNPVVFLNGISHEILCHILEYVYTGEVRIPTEKLKMFSVAAKALHIVGVENITLPMFHPTVGKKRRLEENSDDSKIFQNKAASDTKKVKILKVHTLVSNTNQQNKSTEDRTPQESLNNMNKILEIDDFPSINSNKKIKPMIESADNDEVDEHNLLKERYSQYDAQDLNELLHFKFEVNETYLNNDGEMSSTTINKEQQSQNCNMELQMLINDMDLVQNKSDDLNQIDTMFKAVVNNDDLIVIPLNKDISTEALGTSVINKKDVHCLNQGQQQNLQASNSYDDYESFISETTIKKNYNECNEDPKLDAQTFKLEVHMPDNDNRKKMPLITINTSESAAVDEPPSEYIKTGDRNYKLAVHLPTDDNKKKMPLITINALESEAVDQILSSTSKNIETRNGEEKQDFSNRSSTALYMISNRGKLMLILNRYMYYEHYTSCGGKKRRWRCIDYRDSACKAFLDTEDGLILRRKNIHCHPFHDDKVIKKAQNNKTMFPNLSAAVMAAKEKK